MWHLEIILQTTGPRLLFLWTSACSCRIKPTLKRRWGHVEMYFMLLECLIFCQHVLWVFCLFWFGFFGHFSAHCALSLLMYMPVIITHSPRCIVCGSLKCLHVICEFEQSVFLLGCFFVFLFFPLVWMANMYRHAVKHYCFLTRLKKLLRLFRM